MKKVWTIIVCLLWVFPIHAENMYSEYEDTPCTLYENGELTKFTVTRKYQWYKNKKEIAYFLEGNQPSEYTLLDKNDVKWTPYNEWGFQYPQSKKGREIENRPIYQYTEYKPIQYFFLSDFKGGNGKLYIPEIILYDNEKKVDFEVTCTGCSEGFEDYVKNGEWKEASSYVREDSILKIHILHQKKFTNLGMYLFLYDTTNETKGYTITATHEDQIDDVYYKAIQLHYFQNSSLDKVNPEITYIHNMRKMNPQWDIPKLTTDKIKPTANRIVDVLTQFRYRDSLYKYYKNTKEYYKEYSREAVEDYIYKDKEQYKDFYTCQKRDKRNLSRMVEFFTEDIHPSTPFLLPKKVPYTVDRVYYKESSAKKKAISVKTKTSCPPDASLQKYKSCQQDKQNIFYILFIFCLILIAERLYQKYRKEK